MSTFTFLLLAALIPLWVPCAAVLGGLAVLLVAQVLVGVSGVCHWLAFGSAPIPHGNGGFEQ